MLPPERRVAMVGVMLVLLRFSVSCGGPDRSSCSSDADCASGSYCPTKLCAAPGCGECDLASCRPLAGEGQDCRDAIRLDTCEAGLICNQALGFRCAPAQALNGPCDGIAECAGFEAVDGPVCDLVRKVCAAPGIAVAGDPCSVERACGPDLTCAGFRDSEGGVRGTCLPALPEGTSCAAAPSACADGLTCTSGLCARP